MKSYVLKKEAKRRSYVQGTGGPPPKITFSPFEEEMLQLLTPEAAGLENIPEGGIYTEENPISEDIIQVCNDPPSVIVLPGRRPAGRLPPGDHQPGKMQRRYAPFFSLVVKRDRIEPLHR